MTAYRARVKFEPQRTAPRAASVAADSGHGRASRDRTDVQHRDVTGADQHRHRRELDPGFYFFRADYGDAWRKIHEAAGARRWSVRRRRRRGWDLIAHVELDGLHVGLRRRKPDARK